MIKLFKKLKKRDWFLIAVAVVLIAVQVVLDLSIPEYMTEITSLVQTNEDVVNQIQSIGFKMIASSLGSVILAVIVGYIAANISASLGRTTRQALFEKVNEFTTHDVGQFSIPSLITRTTTDSTQIQLFIAIGLQIAIKSPLLAIASISRIIDHSWQWTALIASGILFLLVIILIIVVFAIPKFNKVQKLTDNINRIMRESLTGINVVRAYNAESYQEKKFEKASSDLAENNLFGTRVVGLLHPSLNFAMSVMSIGIYWIGAYLINGLSASDQLVQFSNMVVYSAYALQIIASFMLMSILLVLLPRVKVSANRINEVLDAPISMENGTINNNVSNYQGIVEFKDVCFTYPDNAQPALKNINFTINKGETLAIIGATGSGKTTLVNLIPRLYEVTSGSVYVDGVDVNDYYEESLYSKIGYVSQKAMLFSGTVADNIDFGQTFNDKITEERITDALELCQSANFVLNKPEGIQSPVAQLGTNFSGGQKQRLSMARAIARDPEILIFDDSFSALDYQTDQKIRQQLNQDFKETTKIIIAQRIGTILDADQIIVLENGEMVGHGKHSELLKTCSVYQEIAKSQLSKEELEDETTRN
ncbi:ABC transporter ATP-binding protein [Erysipelothrix inopinata]|uniref:ABC transporter ATP-binding protein n=1 Tax=Erysipelothrix inopinata TaxID=225084 RepID=A0A7G9S198_9FIRM|nr:ABC transporter ATP-binding protein [Erysipelothrix inopinata]QNN61623.1 ABC transporter ATP-binding protein [Erysipelothrix inopinata]